MLLSLHEISRTIMYYIWESIIRDADALYGLWESKPTLEELALCIIELGPFRLRAGRNKLLLLLVLRPVRRQLV